MNSENTVTLTDFGISLSAIRELIRLKNKGFVIANIQMISKNDKNRKVDLHKTGRVEYDRN